jgi:protein tyrosine/serine phosphatase
MVWSAATALVVSFDHERFQPENIGLPKFGEVGPGFYRSGQPTEAGFRTAAAFGVRTVVDLRTERKRSRKEKAVVESLGMRYVNVPLRGFHKPNEVDIERLLDIVANPTHQPVLIHCRHGVDRTGIVVAAYRIRFDGWSAETAYREMRRFGFRWFLVGMKGFVFDYARRNRQPQAITAAAMNSLW